MRRSLMVLVDIGSRVLILCILWKGDQGDDELLTVIDVMLTSIYGCIIHHEAAQFCAPCCFRWW